MDHCGQVLVRCFVTSRRKIKFRGSRNYANGCKQRINFLWVRWFGRDISFNAGWKAQRLHRVGFLDAREYGAFGFLDPSLVIRGIHLIPAFAHGQTADVLHPPQSVARLPLNENCDWRYYYISM